MSFGGGSGERLGVDAGRISDGAWAATLNAGVYYVGVLGYDADFSQDPNPGWNISTNSNAMGTVRLRVATGQIPSTYWNERHRGADAGDTLGNAQVVEGYGPLTSIVSAFSAFGRDMFKIRICDPAKFAMIVRLTSASGASGGVSYRARLFIFDSNGFGVAAINNTIAQSLTTLTVPNGIPAGDYFVVVQDHCGGVGGQSASPYDADGELIWSFVEQSDWNRVLEPNGPGLEILSFLGVEKATHATASARTTPKSHFPGLATCARKTSETSRSFRVVLRGPELKWLDGVAHVAAVSQRGAMIRAFPLRYTRCHCRVGSATVVRFVISHSFP